MSDYQVLSIVAKHGVDAPALNGVERQQWARVYTLINVMEMALREGYSVEEIRALPWFQNAINEHRVVMHLRLCQRRRLAA